LNQKCLAVISDFLKFPYFWKPFAVFISRQIIFISFDAIYFHFCGIEIFCFS